MTAFTSIRGWMESFQGETGHASKVQRVCDIQWRCRGDVMGEGGGGGGGGHATR